MRIPRDLSGVDQVKRLRGLGYEVTRQCGLIHQEQVFEDNVHTARGQAVHRLVDGPGYEMKSGVKVERPCHCGRSGSA